MLFTTPVQNSLDREILLAKRLIWRDLHLCLVHIALFGRLFQLVLRALVFAMLGKPLQILQRHENPRLMRLLQKLSLLLPQTLHLSVKLIGVVLLADLLNRFGRRVLAVQK